jgi:hypothetical protein
VTPRHPVVLRFSKQKAHSCRITARPDLRVSACPGRSCAPGLIVTLVCVLSNAAGGPPLASLSLSNVLVGAQVSTAGSRLKGVSRAPAPGGRYIPDSATALVLIRQQSSGIAVCRPPHPCPHHRAASRHSRCQRCTAAQPCSCGQPSNLWCPAAAAAAAQAPRLAPATGCRAGPVSRGAACCHPCECQQVEAPCLHGCIAFSLSQCTTESNQPNACCWLSAWHTLG